MKKKYAQELDKRKSDMLIKQIYFLFIMLTHPKRLNKDYFTYHSSLCAITFEQLYVFHI